MSGFLRISVVGRSVRQRALNPGCGNLLPISRNIRRCSKATASIRFYSTSSEGSTRSRTYLSTGLIVSSLAAATLALVSYRALRASKSLNTETSTVLNTTYASPKELQQCIDELRKLFPAEHIVETDPESLKSYGSSENSYHPTSPHSVIVRALSTEDVVKVVNTSRKYRVPITAYSGATSLEGHFGGVCIVHRKDV